MKRHHVLGPLIGVLVSASMAVFAMLCAMGVFGWFSMSHDTMGDGMNIQTKGQEMLQIRASADGPDIGVEVAAIDMGKLPNGMTAGKFIPSAYGDFSFHIHDGSSNRQDAYSFQYSISVVNDEFCGDENYPLGLYPDVGAEELEQVRQYINSHLMFFTSKKNGEYSGWIRPDAPVEPTGNDYPNPVTVYWIWMDRYDYIFQENSGLIEENTRKEIAEYYSREENTAKLLVNGEKSEEAYNVADTMIGMTYKYVCFEIKVFKA